MMTNVAPLFLALVSIGTAFGSDVSGAIWSYTLPGYLKKHISNTTLVEYIYGSSTKFVKK